MINYLGQRYYDVDQYNCIIASLGLRVSVTMTLISIIAFLDFCHDDLNQYDSLSSSVTPLP